MKTVTVITRRGPAKSKVIYTKQFATGTSSATIAVDLYKAGLKSITTPQARFAIQMGASDHRSEEN